MKLTAFMGFYWNQQDFIMDSTVDSIPVKSVMKFIMKWANEIHSEIHDNPKAHNEKCMLFMKSGAFHFSGALHFHVFFTFHVLFTFQVLFIFRCACHMLFTFQVCFSLFMCFSLFSAFMKSASFHTKSTTFYENQQNHVNMCVYMHHLHIIHHQIPPKYKIYLVGLPSVLYERPGQNKRSVESAGFFWLLFRYFSCAFHEKCHFSYKKCHFSWKQTKPGQYMCIHAPFTHICTTRTAKYHQNITYIYLVALPSVLYETPGHNERSVLNQQFLLLFMKSTVKTEQFSAF